MNINIRVISMEYLSSSGNTTHYKKIRFLFFCICDTKCVYEDDYFYYCSFITIEIFSISVIMYILKHNSNTTQTQLKHNSTTTQPQLNHTLNHNSTTTQTHTRTQL